MKHNAGDVIGSLANHIVPSDFILPPARLMSFRDVMVD